MKECILSPLAERKLQGILQYLKEEWSEKIAQEFLQGLEEALEQVAHHPESSPVSKKKKGVRKCVVSKKTSLFYRIRKDRVEVITILDNREDRSHLDP